MLRDKRIVGGVFNVTQNKKSNLMEKNRHFPLQKHSLLMPEDLKNFFMTSNGFHLTWSVKMESKFVLQVSLMLLSKVPVVF